MINLTHNNKYNLIEDQFFLILYGPLWFYNQINTFISTTVRLDCTWLEMLDLQCYIKTVVFEIIEIRKLV